MLESLESYRKKKLGNTRKARKWDPERKPAQRLRSREGRMGLLFLEKLENDRKARKYRTDGKPDKVKNVHRKVAILV